MTEEIINRLSNLKDLKVPARTSVFAFKGTSLDVREIGKKLGVEAVLEGSVRKSGRQLRITAQLINVTDAFHLWSRTYDREMEDVFSIQSDVAQQIALAMDAALSPVDREKLERKATANLDAYTLYLQGRFYWRRRTPEDLEEAVRNFTDAVRLDPRYALAYVGLADAYALFPFYGVRGMSTEEAFRRAEEASKKALALDSTLAEGHTSLANVLKDGHWNWAAAEREFKRALELNPRYATARQWYSENLMAQGRRAEALEQARIAYDLEPSSVVIGNNLGLQYLMNRQYAEAIACLKQAIELDPTFSNLRANLASAYFMTSAFREAAAELRSTPTPPEAIDRLLGAWLDTTKREAVIREVDAIPENSPGLTAPGRVRIYSSLGDRDRTFEWLRRCCASRNPELLYAIRHPVLDRFLPDQRHTAILKEMGLQK
jgi:serine/threonine-protein kinase